MGLTGHVEVVKKNKQYRLVVNMPKEFVSGKWRYPKKRQDVYCGGIKEAEALLPGFIKELEQPQKKYSDQLTSEYMLYWLNTVAKPNLEQNTYDSYLFEIEQYINPGIGHIPISELVSIHIQKIYSYWLEAGRKNKIKSKDEDKPQGLSNRSIEYKHSILNQAFKYAVKPLKLIPENPCEGIRPPKSKETQEEKMTVLSKEELKKFLDEITGHMDYAEIFVASYTGMRISELLALTWPDILWDEGKIRINKTLHKLKDSKYILRPRTKNKQARTIDVSKSVMEVLKQHKKYLMSKGLLNNKFNLVFPDTNKHKGQPQDRKNLYHRFVNIASKFGYKGMRFHDLRHTHATILLEAGEMINAVSERLGHLDVATTSRTYAHVRAEKAKATADMFEQLMES